MLLLFLTLFTHTILSSNFCPKDIVHLPFSTELHYNRQKHNISLIHGDKPMLLHHLTSSDSAVTATCFKITGILSNNVPKINYHLFDNVTDNNCVTNGTKYLYIVLNFNEPQQSFTYKKIVPLLLQYHSQKNQHCFIVNKHIEHTRLSKTVISIIAHHLQSLHQRHITSQQDHHALIQNLQQEADEELDQYHA